MPSIQDPVLISKPASTTHTKSQRLPAPTLFVGPQSLNASQVSVNRNATPEPFPASSTNDGLLASSSSAHAATNKLLKASSTLRYPLERSRSGLAYRTPHPNQLTPSETKTSASIDGRGADSAKPANDGDQLRVPGSLRKPSDRSLDAKWRDMQAALNEVELRAQNTTQIFGSRHAAALDELRRAQIELARAWDRNEDERKTEVITAAATTTTTDDAGKAGAPSERPGTGRAAHKSRSRPATIQSASTALTGESWLSSEDVDETASNATETNHETAQDIRQGTERRTANEAYFRTVDRSVKEVVVKLQHVAEAMKQVESESRSLWSESMADSADAMSNPPSSLGRHETE